jgi:hypothetical protein
MKAPTTAIVPPTPDTCVRTIPGMFAAQRRSTKPKRGRNTSQNSAAYRRRMQQAEMEEGALATGTERPREREQPAKKHKHNTVQVTVIEVQERAHRPTTLAASDPSGPTHRPNRPAVAEKKVEISGWIAATNKQPRAEYIRNTQTHIHGKHTRTVVGKLQYKKGMFGNGDLNYYVRSGYITVGQVEPAPTEPGSHPQNTNTHVTVSRTDTPGHSQAQPIVQPPITPSPEVTNVPNMDADADKEIQMYTSNEPGDLSHMLVPPLYSPTPPPPGYFDGGSPDRSSDVEVQDIIHANNPGSRAITAPGLCIFLIEPPPECIVTNPESPNLVQVRTDKARVAIDRMEAQRRLTDRRLRVLTHLPTPPLILPDRQDAIT